MKKECNCKMCELVKQTILFMSDCRNMAEAINYFEKGRHKKSLYRTREFFEELVISQLGILFKLLIDTDQVKVVNNQIVENKK